MFAPVQSRRRGVVPLLSKGISQSQSAFVVVYVTHGAGEAPDTSNSLRQVPVLHRYEALVKTSGLLEFCSWKKARSLDCVIADVAATFECSRLSPETLSNGGLRDDHCWRSARYEGVHTVPDNIPSECHVGINKQQVSAVGKP